MGVAIGVAMNARFGSLATWVCLLLFVGWVAPWAPAGDYEADLKRVLAVLNQKAGEIGMLNGERRKYEDAIKRYGDERERLLTQMIGLLAYYNPSGIQSTWQDLCGKGK